MGRVGPATLISLGTRSRWPRHGLATTLISRALAGYQQAGLTENPVLKQLTGAIRLKIVDQLSGAIIR